MGISEPSTVGWYTLGRGRGEVLHQEFWHFLHKTTTFGIRFDQLTKNLPEPINLSWAFILEHGGTRGPLSDVRLQAGGGFSFPPDRSLWSLGRLLFFCNCPNSCYTYHRCPEFYVYIYICFLILHIHHTRKIVFVQKPSKAFRNWSDQPFFIWCNISLGLVVSILFWFLTSILGETFNC